MTFLDKAKKYHEETNKKVTAFFNYAERPTKLNVKKSFDFGKTKKVKKSFKGEGLKL